MLKIYEKTEKEIDEELKIFCLKQSQELTQKYRKSICTTYVITKEGHRVDTDELGEKQVLGLCKSAIITAFNKNDFYLLNEAFRLANITSARIDLSYAGLKEIVPMLKDNRVKVRAWSADIFGCFDLTKYHNACLITKFLEQSKGNFNEPNKNQICNTLDIMEKNEQKMIEKYSINKK